MIHPALTDGPASAGKRIGLLGGSFNPAHEGHVAISLYALKRLRLDEIWWLVSPQNPLKPKTGMAPLSARLRQARSVSKDCQGLHVSALEAKLGTRYTVDTIRALRRHMPRARFVWLMGADNLIQVSRWRRWDEIFQTVPIAVFRRPGYAAGTASSEAAQRFASSQQKIKMAASLASMTPPAWLILDNKDNPLSATMLRRRGAKKKPTEKDRDTWRKKGNRPQKAKRKLQAKKNKSA